MDRVRRKSKFCIDATTSTDRFGVGGGNRDLDRVFVGVAA